MASSHSMARKFLVSLASVAGFLVVLELALRIVGFKLPPAVPPIVIWNRDEDKKLDAENDLHAATPRQLWAPRPLAAVPWGSDSGERINDAGYRGPKLELAKTPGVLRIATFGDSSTFGMGVPYDATYSARLISELAKRGVTAEVLDAGVIGFTVEQGFERWKELVEPYRPDVVTLAFGAVNDHLPTPDLEDREKIAESVRRFDARRPFVDGLREHVRVIHLAAWLAEKLNGFDRTKLAEEWIKARGAQAALEATMGQVNWPGKRRVSLARFDDTLTRFAQAARADGAAVVFVSMPRHAEVEHNSPVLLEYNAVVERVAKRLGAPLFDARATILAKLAEGKPWSELFVDHYHPSKAGHAIYAERLAELIAECARAK